MTQAPCKDCKIRQLNCHSKCQQYKDFKKELSIASVNRNKDNDIRMYETERSNRLKRGRGKRR